MVVVALVACVGSILTVATPDTSYHDDKDSPDSWTGGDPWNEVDKMMEELPVWGTAGREGVNAWDGAEERLKEAWSRSRRREAVMWDKMDEKMRSVWESITSITFPPENGDERTVEKPFPSWAEKWRDMEGKFRARDSASSKTIKFGPIKNCCELWSALSNSACAV